MPIYMKIEGVKGRVEPSGNAGGLKKFGTGTLVLNNTNTFGGAYSGAFSGGVRVAVSDINSDNASGISVSRISIPNSPSDAIDALTPNAVVKAIALFEAQRSRVTSLGVVFSIPTNGANKLRSANNLRQISLAASGQISTVRLFITDGSNQIGVTVELENVRITNYSVSGHGGNAPGVKLFSARIMG